MKKAIFLDRDGTINVEKHFLYKIEDFEFLPGVIDGLRLLQDAGYLLIIVTNQSGIARGYYTEDDFIMLNKWMLQTLEGLKIEISKVYYCPHLPDANVEKYRVDCDCRKPKLGMYKQAISDFDIDINRSYAIGDKIRDCTICNVSACRGVLIGDSERDDIIIKVKEGKIRNVCYQSSLLKFAELITFNI